MPPKRKKQPKKKQRSYLKTKLTLLFLLVCILLGLYWYGRQPFPQRKEFNRICGACFFGAAISLVDATQDIYELYNTSAPSSSFAPDPSSPVFGGNPTRTDGSALRLLVNTAYSVGYDEQMRLPAWAAYKLFDAPSPTLPDRPTLFLPDTRTSTPVLSEDYTGSGFDRGHLAPNFAIARCYGEEAQRETFLLSNVVPQQHGFNAGLWKSLELREALNYVGRFQEIWVLTGPVFGQEIHCLPSGLAIPEQLFKIIVDIQNGKIRVIALLMPQNSQDDKHFDKYLCSIDEIEAKTSLDFFPDLSWEEQNALEAQPAPFIW